MTKDEALKLEALQVATTPHCTTIACVLKAVKAKLKEKNT